MRFVPRAVSVLFIIALPVFIVTANIRFFAGEAWFYERGFREHDAAGRTGLPLSELDRAGAEIRRYFEDDARNLSITVTVDGNQQPLFNDREVQHMADVKDLMRLLFRVNEVTLAIILTVIAGRFLWAREAPLRVLARDTLLGLGLGGIVALGIGALALTGFDAAWTRFHEIAFSNDLWRLDPSRDRLIQMFPEEFWQEAVLIITGMVVAEALVIAACAAAYLWSTRQARSTAESADVRNLAPAARS